MHVYMNENGFLCLNMCKDTAIVYICVELYIIYNVVLVFTLLYTLVMLYICLPVCLSFIRLCKVITCLFDSAISLRSVYALTSWHLLPPPVSTG